MSNVPSWVSRRGMTANYLLWLRCVPRRCARCERPWEFGQVVCTCGSSSFVDALTGSPAADLRRAEEDPC